MISRGTSLLNNRSYGSVWKQGDEKGEVFYLIGNSYYNLENYEAASEYFTYALEENPDNMIYYRDGAIAAVKAGDETEAKYLLECAGERGMDNVQINLIRANLAAEEEDWEEVILAAGAEQSRAEQSSVFGCFEGNMCVFGGMYSRPFSWKSW